MLIEGRASGRQKKKKGLILPNDWSHVVKGKIRLFDTGAKTERVEREEKTSERETEV